MSLDGTSREKIAENLALNFFVLYCLVIVPVTFFLIEGLSSTILFYRDTTKTIPMAETFHSEYDEELGWVNRPNMVIEDMYGPGVYVRTNAQGFRNHEDFTAKVPDGKVRAICSGDSFTFGYGVDNDHTWCQLLAGLDDRLQTVNMGQGAYGVDQAYLWYKRDGLKLQHDLHLFAFITHDFERIEFEEFMGYGKPVLSVEDDRLVINNVPAPQFPGFIHWIIRNRFAMGRLRSIQLLNSMRSLDTNEVSAQTETLPPADDDPSSFEEQGPEIVATKIFADLRDLHNSQNSTLVLVYLPTLKDYDDLPETTRRGRQYIRHLSEELDIIVIDLVDEFRKLPRYEVREMFFPEDTAYRGAAGHYSARGNAYVARLLYDKLLAIPEVAEKIDSK